MRLERRVRARKPSRCLEAASAQWTSSITSTSGARSARRSSSVSTPSRSWTCSNSSRSRASSWVRPMKAEPGVVAMPASIAPACDVANGRGPDTGSGPRSRLVGGLLAVGGLLGRRGLAGLERPEPPPRRNVLAPLAAVAPYAAGQAGLGGVAPQVLDVLLDQAVVVVEEDVGHLALRRDRFGFRHC